MITRKPFSVRTRTVSDALCDLPDVRPADPEEIGSIDLLICASGFEERVLAVPEYLAAQAIAVSGKIVLGRYRTNPDDNARREQELMPALQAVCSNPIDTFDADSPFDTNRVISGAIESLEGQGEVTVAVDISGGSSTYIFSVLASVLSSDRSIRLVVLYAAAQTYHEPNPACLDSPPFQWGDADLRETGVSEVDVNELYPGHTHDHFPTYAIALPSMFPERMMRCLSHLGLSGIGEFVDRIFWILPSTTDPSHAWRLQYIETVAAKLSNGQLPTEVSATPVLPDGSFTHCDVFDYKSSARIVLERVALRPGHNFSLVHMGTKLQAVGAALALAARPEISLINARPKSFAAASYSKGATDIHQIVFSDAKGAVEALASTGSLEVTSGGSR